MAPVATDGRGVYAEAIWLWAVSCGVLGAGRWTLGELSEERENG